MAGTVFPGPQAVRQSSCRTATRNHRSKCKFFSIQYVTKLQLVAHLPFEKQQDAPWPEQHLSSEKCSSQAEVAEYASAAAEMMPCHCPTERIDKTKRGKKKLCITACRFFLKGMIAR